MKIGNVVAESCKIILGGIRFYKSKAKSILFLLAASFILSSFSEFCKITGIVKNMSYPEFIISVIGIVFFFVSIIINGVLIRAVFDIKNERFTTIKESYLKMKKSIPEYLLNMLIVDGAVIAGVILFVIPGILAAAFLSFAGIAVILEKSKKPLKRSYLLSKEKPGVLFFINAVYILLLILLIYITGNVSVESAPYWGILFNLLKSFVIGPLYIIIVIDIYSSIYSYRNNNV